MAQNYYVLIKKEKMKLKLILLALVSVFLSGYSQQKRAGSSIHPSRPATTVLPPSTNLKWVKDPQTSLYGLVDSVTNKKIIPPKYFDVHSFINNTCMVQLEDDIHPLTWQLINAKGVPLLNTPVDFVMDEYHNLIVVERDYLFGIINRLGKVVVPLKYRLISKIPDEDFFFLQDKDSTSYYYHESGAIFNKALKYSSGLYLVGDNKDHYGLFSTKQKKLLLPLKYGPFLDFTNGRTLITENKKFGLLSDSGRIVIPCIYDLLSIDNSNLIWVKKDSLQGLFDIYGNNVLPVVYNEIYKFGWNLAKIELKGKLGLINKKGKIVLPAEYDAIGSTDKYYTIFNKGGHWVDKDNFDGGLWGLITILGDIIVQPRYSYIFPFSDDMALVAQGGVYNPTTKSFDGALYGYINKQGEEVIYPIFKSASDFKNGNATVTIGARTYKIDKNGKKVHEGYDGGFNIPSSH